MNTHFVISASFHFVVADIMTIVQWYLTNAAHLIVKLHELKFWRINDKIKSTFFLKHYYGSIVYHNVSCAQASQSQAFVLNPTILTKITHLLTISPKQLRKHTHLNDTIGTIKPAQFYSQTGSRNGSKWQLRFETKKNPNERGCLINLSTP